MPEPLKLPITFDHCPACFGTERLGDLTKQLLIDQGYFSPDAKFEKIFTTQLVDQEKIKQLVANARIVRPDGKIHTTIKLLQERWDVCAKCGTLYCVSWNIIDQEADIAVTAGPPPGAQRPPFRNIPGGIPR